MTLILRRIQMVGLALSLCMSLAWSGPVAAQSDRPWVENDRYGDFVIVVGQSPSETVRFAASELQELWEQSTGHRPPIKATRVSGKVNVWLGRDDNPHISSEDVEGLGRDGLLIRTQDSAVWPRRSSLRHTKRDAVPLEIKRLVIAGKTDRGTLYGVYEFLRRYLGVRWFAPKVTAVAPPPAFLREMDYRYVPPFAYRDVSARVFINSPGFAVRHALNGMWSAVPDSMGGHTGYVAGKWLFGHTFHHYVSPEKYFDEHPEYFSEVDGVRVRDSQLCLTNPDVLAITVENALAIMRQAQPNDRIISISQMDRGLWCTCANCHAFDKAKGSHAGTILHFVNRVAEAIEGEFPEAFVDTFAYVYSRKPPRRIKPRDNVIVRLCAIEADYSTPLSDASSVRNSSFAKDLRGWGKITKNLYVWDYTLNWYSHLGPHPNLPVLQPNAKFFADAGVVGVYEQASPVSPHTDFEHLKAYILARSLWDPTVDWRQLRDEFLPAYYGPAAPFIREYLDLLAKRVEGDDVILTMANSMQWMDYDTVVAAEEIFRRAFEATPSEPFRKRLKHARLPVSYAAMVCPPKVEVGSSAYHLKRPPSQSFDDLWATLKKYSITHYNDHPIGVFRNALGSKKPPRRQRVPFVSLENDRVSVWVVPSMKGIVGRLLDKQAGIEIAPRHDDILRRPRRPRGWNQADYAAGSVSAGPGSYTVIGRGNKTLELEAAYPNGLSERRTFSLDGESGALRVTMEYTNGSDTSLPVPASSLVPFVVDEDSPRRIWLRTKKRWKRTKVSEERGGLVKLRRVGECGPVEWAVRVGDEAYILYRVTATGIQGLHTAYYQAHGETFGEAWPSLPPIQPGESRSVTVEIRAEATLD